MNLFKYTAFILISLISVYAPYVAYLNHSPNTVIENIDIEIGESISQVAFELSDHNNSKATWLIDLSLIHISEPTRLR